ncbi:hypothetical protein DPMN_068777 [Dreissena polymorpha]|uniref:Uncharacterized protein n=1 Tax=Dreissena polymorpha TaxID=45954 RepID=A0A9D3Z292_DREPO|nr:hypothetical protein DPMN_068777 [Dreissena polymorpha]
MQDLIERLKTYCIDTLSHVSLSVLDPGHDKPIKDIYVTPKRHRVVIQKNGVHTKVDQIHKYKYIFNNGDTLNRRIFLQGEPGMGKLTFAAKLVLDCCNQSNPSSETSTEVNFDDVETLH